MWKCLGIISYGNLSAGVGVLYFDGNSVFGKYICDAFAPFDNDDIGWILEIFLEVVLHEAGIGKAVEVIVDELFVVW